MESYQLIKFEDVCIQHQLDDDFIYNLKEYEIVNFIVKDNTHYVAIEEMPIIERIIRLHYDLHINMEGIAVIQQMRSKIEMMQLQIRQLNNRLNLYE